jgi:hypothetical protein
MLAVATTANAAFMDITRPGDPIALVNGVNELDGDAGPPPANEQVARAIDDVGQKYLNFLDLNSGFSVTPSLNHRVVTGVRFYTANDAEVRDPASYQLFATNEGLDAPAASWLAIASGNLALPSGRNAGGNAVVIPPEGNLAAFNQEVTFANTTAYKHYRVVFPTLKDAASANSMQIAEVELLTFVPEPSCALIGGLAMAFGALRRRRS